MSEAMRQELNDVKATLAHHSNTLAEVKATLGHHSDTLAHHTDTLAHHTDTLARHTDTLARHSDTLAHHTDLLRNLAIEQARARGDIEWLKENMVTRTEYRAGMDQILGKLDGIAGKLEDSRYDSAKNLNRLDDHERRIRTLETKPS